MPSGHVGHTRRLLAGMSVVGLAVGLLASSSAGAGGVTAIHTVTNQWTSGYQAAVTVRNGTGAPLKAWRLEFELPHKISSMWDAVLVNQAGGHVVVDAPAWQRDL